MVLTPLAACPVTFALSNPVANNSQTYSSPHTISLSKVYTIPVPYKCAVAINPSTNKMYISDQNSNLLHVLNIGTGEIKNITVSHGSCGLGINPITNKIYLTNANNFSITVLDGETDKILKTVQLPSFTSPLEQVKFNVKTNVVYINLFEVTGHYGNIPNDSSGILVINGTTDDIINIIPSTNHTLWDQLDVNPDTNEIYAVSGMKEITTIDGSTDKVTGNFTITKNNQIKIAIDPTLNKVFASDSNSSSVYVLDGQNNRIIANVTLPINSTVMVTNNQTSPPPLNPKSPLSKAIAHSPFPIAVSEPSGILYVSNTRMGILYVLDGQNYKILQTIRVGYLFGYEVIPINDSVYLTDDTHDIYKLNDITVPDFTTGSIGIISAISLSIIILLTKTRIK